MAYQWDMIASDAPPMQPYNDDYEYHVEAEDIYITDAFLNPAHDIPGIPAKYANEESQGRALYVHGVPDFWKAGPTGPLKTIFGLWGQVDKFPILISLSAEKTFRWVIMASEADALMAMDQLHGRTLEGGCLAVSKSLPPGRTLTLVNQQPLAEQPEMEMEYSEEEFEFDNTLERRLYHGHPSPIPDTSDEKTPMLTDFKFPPTIRVQDTDAASVATTDDGTDIQSPEIPAPTQSPLTSPTKDKKDTFTTQASSWANIAGKALSATGSGSNVIDLKPQHKSAGPRLKPVRRIPSVVKISERDAQRLVFLLNLPQNITAADITNAVKEGPLVKLQFGFDAEAKQRYCGVIFQFAQDAAAFEEVLEREKRESRPNRFRFIVEHARAEQVVGIEDTLAAMGHPMFATRRLTIVKAGFFFMFGQRQLKDLCEKLVGGDCVQLIWLYNGGNATIVFTDVAAAIKVKKDFDRKSTRGLSGGETAIWAGVQTTFSKDPCVAPLELKTAMQD
ncbi:uncharacterized protein PAC_05399 [Phialocephala subalpina]|uniref:RRM domain-containing protein n=1 Tax=Phialocephala subalpina TaxID=576137 RepID=A0A1L7WRW5_9HELO|nr:uncharacterized protein PAC_05399 [Phialocephala subalpina]